MIRAQRCEHLEQHHWEYLYSLVSSEQKLGRDRHSGQQRMNCTRILEAVRVSICAHLELAEELMPMDNLAAFFQKHEKYAQLALQFPEARISKDSLERCAVEAYEKILLVQELARTTHECMGKAGHGLFERSCSVARESSIIVFPRASAEACLVAAYVMAKCQEAFGRVSWLLSTLTGIQAPSRISTGLLISLSG